MVETVRYFLEKRERERDRGEKTLQRHRREIALTYRAISNGARLSSTGRFHVAFDYGPISTREYSGDIVIVRADIKDAEKHLAKDYPEFHPLLDAVQQSVKEWEDKVESYRKANNFSNDSEIPPSSEIFRESQEIGSRIRPKLEAVKQRLADLVYDIDTEQYETMCDCCRPKAN